MILLLSLALLCVSCKGAEDFFASDTIHDPIDPERQLTRGDYRGLTNIPPIPEAAKGPPPIPEIAPIIAAPLPPKLGATKLVSLAVTDDVPLKDVLIELSRLADIDIEIDAGIEGGIAFRAKDRPFNEVIDRIADLAGLRYSMKNGVLRVERDTPVVEMYSLDFLSIERTSSSSISVSTSGLGGGEGGGSSSSSSSGDSGGGGSSGGGGGLSSGSSASISMSSASDFWAQFEEGIKQILSYTPPSRLSGASAAPAAASGAAPAAAAGEKTVALANGAFYIINRQASTLTVSATDRQHRLLKEFLKRVHSNASAQVLIEAKIVEVTLNEEFQSGVDWNALGKDSKFKLNPVDLTAPSTGGNTLNPLTFAFEQLGQQDFNLDLAVRLAETFGTTRTLSSPRLHAINNQQAVMTFAENFVYFEVDIESNSSTTSATGTTSTGTLETNVTTNVKTVPVGIILAMQPSVNLDTNEITLSVRPTLSRLVRTVSDPSIVFAKAKLPEGTAGLDSLQNIVPVLEIRELDSVMKLRSGQVLVMGGLMEDTIANQDTGLPGASEVPYLGNLFKGVGKSNKKKELVIFIRATVVDSSNSADETDRKVYQKFIQDPRPLKF